MVESRTARNAERRSACGRYPTPFGIPRSMGFRAVWDSAPYGIPRRLAFRAIWRFALSGVSRRLAFRAASSCLVR